MEQNTKNNLVIMGTVINAFGILGFIKIRTDSESGASSLSRYKSLHLQINGKWIAHSVTKSQVHDNILNTKLSGIDDRNEAIKLKGCRVAVPRNEFPKIKDPNEYYWVDLIDLTVINKDNVTLGQVKNLIDSGANSVLVVEGELQHLIPFVDAYIVKVDIEKKEIIVDWGIDY